MLRKISLAKLGLIVGGIITVVGTVAYFADYATLNLAGFFYGIPLLLGGLALKAAELKPIPFSQPTSPEILTLKQQQATSIQTQIINDITRYRYGQDAHLDDALNRLGLSPSNEERPVLESLRETEIAGNYALILEFYSPFISLDIWQQKQEKITKFFGPNIRVEITQPGEDSIDLALIATPETTS